VQEGEALSVSYIDGDVPRAARREALRSSYSFCCDCRRCGSCQPTPCQATQGALRLW